MTQRITRRAIVAAGLPILFAAAANQTSKSATGKKSRSLPAVGEFVRFIDPTTESMVVRLTNPASASYLPIPGNRFVSVRERLLIFSSDRTGRATPFAVDLRTGVLRPLTVTTNLVPRSLCLDTQGRSVYLIDGTDLKRVSIANKRVEVLARGVSAFSVGNSSSEVIVVKEGRLEQLNGQAGVLADGVAPWCAVRPGGTGCAFSRAMPRSATSAGDFAEQEFWYVPAQGSLGASPRLLAKGKISNPLWSPDGAALLFLRQVPANNAFVSEIHGADPDAGIEQRIAPTSQFAAFAPNGDASVFVGASRSKAQPTVILLLRSVLRELTLCEHRATHPFSVDPAFSPDSRRVYFQSDHEGKSALYSVNTEALVEPTPSAF